MGYYGIVYIARNDQHPPNVYKIGGSSRDVDERMRELSNETATYGTFEAKAYFPVTDWEAAEKKCHYQLSHYRADKKEFFTAPYNQLVEVVRNVCDDFQPKQNVEQPTDGMSKALFLKPALPTPTERKLIAEAELAELKLQKERVAAAEQEKAYQARKLAQQKAQYEAEDAEREKKRQSVRDAQLAKWKEEENWFFASVWPLTGVVLVLAGLFMLLGFTGQLP